MVYTKLLKAKIIFLSSPTYLSQQAFSNTKFIELDFVGGEQLNVGVFLCKQESPPLSEKKD